MADYVDTKVSNLVINNLTQEKYDELLASGQINPDELYCTPARELTSVATDDTITGDGTPDNPLGLSDSTKNAIDTALSPDDAEFIAHQAMPSRRTLDLTLGASGSVYTAPADGTVLLLKTGNAGQYATIDCYSNKSYFNYSAASQACSLSLQVSKGDSFVVWYDASGATDRFVFIYANGAK